MNSSSISWSSVFRLFPGCWNLWKKFLREVNGRREELTGPCKTGSYWTLLKASFQRAKERPMNFNLKGARSRRIALKVLNKVKYFSVYYIRNSTCQALSPWLLCMGFCVDYWGTLYLGGNRGGGGGLSKNVIIIPSSFFAYWLRTVYFFFTFLVKCFISEFRMVQKVNIV